MKRFSIAGGLAALLIMAASPLTSLATMQAPVPVSIAVDLDPASAAGIRIEGLVSDSQGRLYTSDLDSRRFFRFTPSTSNLETLGTLPRTASGNLYMASGDVQGTQVVTGTGWYKIAVPGVTEPTYISRDLVVIQQ